MARETRALRRASAAVTAADAAEPTSTSPTSKIYRSVPPPRQQHFPERRRTIRTYGKTRRSTSARLLRQQTITQMLDLDAPAPIVLDDSDIDKDVEEPCKKRRRTLGDEPNLRNNVLSRKPVGKPGSAPSSAVRSKSLTRTKRDKVIEDSEADPGAADSIYWSPVTAQILQLPSPQKESGSNRKHLSAEDAVKTPAFCTPVKQQKMITRTEIPASVDSVLTTMMERYDQADVFASPSQLVSQRRNGSSTRVGESDLTPSHLRTLTKPWTASKSLTRSIPGSTQHSTNTELIRTPSVSRDSPHDQLSSPSHRVFSNHAGYKTRNGGSTTSVERFQTPCKNDVKTWLNESSESELSFVPSNLELAANELISSLDYSDLHTNELKCQRFAHDKTDGYDDDDGDDGDERDENKPPQNSCQLGAVELVNPQQQQSPVAASSVALDLTGSRNFKRSPLMELSQTPKGSLRPTVSLAGTRHLLSSPKPKSPLVSALKNSLAKVTPGKKTRFALSEQEQALVMQLSRDADDSDDGPPSPSPMPRQSEIADSDDELDWGLSSNDVTPTKTLGKSAKASSVSQVKSGPSPRRPGKRYVANIATETQCYGDLGAETQAIILDSFTSMGKSSTASGSKCHPSPPAAVAATLPPILRPTRKLKSRVPLNTQFESQRLPMHIIKELNPYGSEHADVFVSFPPDQVECISQSTKNHIFRDSSFPPTVARLWIYTSKPLDELRYMARIGPPKQPGQIVNGLGGLGNADFNKGNEAEFAYEILQVYELNNPVTLEDMIAEGWVNVAPRNFVEVPPAVVGELVGNLRCELFEEGVLEEHLVDKELEVVAAPFQSDRTMGQPDDLDPGPDSDKALAQVKKMDADVVAIPSPRQTRSSRKRAKDNDNYGVVAVVVEEEEEEEEEERIAATPRPAVRKKQAMSPPQPPSLPPLLRERCSDEPFSVLVESEIIVETPRVHRSGRRSQRTYKSRSRPQNPQSLILSQATTASEPSSPLKNGKHSSTVAQDSNSTDRLLASDFSLPQELEGSPLRWKPTKPFTGPESQLLSTSLMLPESMLSEREGLLDVVPESDHE